MPIRHSWVFTVSLAVLLVLGVGGMLVAHTNPDHDARDADPSAHGCPNGGADS